MHREVHREVQEEVQGEVQGAVQGEVLRSSTSSMEDYMNTCKGQGRGIALVTLTWQHTCSPPTARQASTKYFLSASTIFKRKFSVKMHIFFAMKHLQLGVSVSVMDSLCLFWRFSVCHGQSLSVTIFFLQI